MSTFKIKLMAPTRTLLRRRFKLNFQIQVKIVKS